MSTLAATDEMGAAWAAAEAALPEGTCDLAVYHYDEGPAVDGGEFGLYATHKTPARYGAKTALYPKGVEVYGYGMSPAEALNDLILNLAETRP